MPATRSLAPDVLQKRTCFQESRNRESVMPCLSSAGNVLRGYPRLHCLLERGARPIKLRKLMKLCNVTLTNVQVSFEAGSGGADCVVLGVLAM